MRLAVLLLASGCTQLLGVHDFEAAAPDAPARTCRGSRWSACFVGELPEPRTISGDVDTDDPACASALEDGTPACIIAASSMTVSVVRAHGSRPLVLVADDMVIAGTLDASSESTAKHPGPAADPPDCEPATPGWPEDNTHLRGSGGGAGGSFGRDGGAGGNVPDSPLGGNDQGAGKPADAIQLRGLYGGCPGSAGGAPLASVASGPHAAAPGHGGGAVLVIATTLELDGEIDVSGSGGGAGGAIGTLLDGHGGGGGGGGSGGLVVLEVGSLAGNGSVRANGGGGGGGGSNTGAAGRPGADGGGDGTCAIGGAGGTASSAGGTGGCNKLDALAGAAASGKGSGGGGGGGAVGLILASQPPHLASPPAGVL